MDERLKNKLRKREIEGTMRSLSHFDGFVDFFSNDYLGMAREKTENFSDKYGGTGSRLISGSSKEVLIAEQVLADFYKAEAALFFNSGYDANIGFFSCVPQRGDTVVYDELIHASIRDGIRLGFADSLGFEHNNLTSLKNRLEKANGIIYVVVESLYSMDGDVAPLIEIVELCEIYGANLIVDEAHAAGILGKDGTGLVVSNNLSEKIFARLITFGKAYGSHGAIYLCSSELKKFLINFSRPFIYTTALPPEVYSRNTSNAKDKTINNRREKLRKNIDYYRSKIKKDLLVSDKNSPIQVIIIGDVSTAKKIVEDCSELGIATKAVFSPTVPKGEERIRVCLHSFNSISEIDRLVEVIKKSLR